MRRILFLLLAIMFAMQGWSQGFEKSFTNYSGDDDPSFPGDGWVTYAGPSTSSWRSYNDSPRGIAARANGDYANGGKGGSLLVSPKVIVTAKLNTVTFETWAPNTTASTYGVKLNVLISETNTGIESFTEVIGTITYSAANTIVSASATVPASYYGKDVYIAFQHEDDPGNGFSYSSAVFIRNVAMVSCPKPVYTAVSPRYSQIDLTFSDSRTYNLKYKKSTDATYTIVKNPISVNYSIMNLDADTKYDIAVTANCDGEVSSEVITSVTTLVSCPQPTALSGVSNSWSSIDLKWKKGASEAAWTVNWKLSTDVTYPPANTKQVTDTFTVLTDLLADKTYNVQVIANCGGSLGDSKVTTANVTTLQSCFVPTNLKAAVTAGLNNDNSIKFTWTASTGAETAWIINDGTNDYQVTGTPEYTFLGLGYGVKKTVTVRANCGGDLGESRKTSAVSATTPFNVPYKSAYTTFASAVSPGNNTAPEGWIHYKATGAGNYTVSLSSSNITIGSNNTTPYAYKTFLLSPEVKLDKNCVLTYSHSRGSSSTATPSYKVYLTKDVVSTSDFDTTNKSKWIHLKNFIRDSIPTTETVVTIPINISDADKGFYRLAIVRASTSNQSGQIIFQGANPLSIVVNEKIPSGLKVSPENITMNEANITWNKIEGYSYEIAYKENSEANFRTIAVNDTSYTFSGLIKETTYNVKLSSVDANGDKSLYSNVVNFTTLPSCYKPYNVKIDRPTYTSINVTWEDSILTQNQWIFSYRKGTTDPFTSVLTSNKYYSLSELEVGATYYVNVRAFCAIGDTSAVMSNSSVEIN